MKHEVIQRAIFAVASGGSEDVTSELVPRLVLLYRITNPIVERPHRIRAQLAARNQQQIGPFICPVIDEFIAFK